MSPRLAEITNLFRPAAKKSTTEKPSRLRGDLDDLYLEDEPFEAVTLFPVPAKRSVTPPPKPLSPVNMKPVGRVADLVKHFDKTLEGEYIKVETPESFCERRRHEEAELKR
jgi:hypothetical protein